MGPQQVQPPARQEREERRCRPWRAVQRRWRSVESVDVASNEAYVVRYASFVLVNEVPLKGCVRCAYLERLFITAFDGLHLYGEREPASPTRAGFARDIARARGAGACATYATFHLIVLKLHEMIRYGTRRFLYTWARSYGVRQVWLCTLLRFLWRVIGVVSRILRAGLAVVQMNALFACCRRSLQCLG